jgi:hypothetical protein
MEMRRDFAPSLKEGGVLAEEFGDGAGEAGDNWVAGEDVGRGFYDDVGARTVDGYGFQVGIDDPYGLAAGVEPRFDLFIDFACAVAWGEDFDGEVRRAGPESLGGILSG